MTSAGVSVESRLPAPEELIAFLDDLRRQGWAIDVGQMSTCCQVLAQARRDGNASAWCKRLPYRLTPIIARKPHEQVEFSKLFITAFPQGPEVTGGGQATVTPVMDPPVRVPFYQHSSFIGTVALALVVGLGLLAYGLAPPAPKVEDAPPSEVLEARPLEALPQPEKTIDVAPRSETQTRTIPSPIAPALSTLAIAAPLILLLGWLAWRWGHRLLWLSPGAVPPDIRLSRLQLPASVTRALFTSMSFRAAAQDLRRHRPVASTDLDVDRSIEATVLNAGFFTAVPRPRPQLPEYVFLIERLASNDHLARLFDFAVARLRHEGAIVSAYFYHDDPRHLTPAGQPDALIGIRDLAGLADEHRLLVVGTADGLFHPISGDLHRWIHDFEPWSSRTVLSTRSIEEWTHSELQLLQEGFSLATARSSGLTRLADRVTHGIDAEPELLEGVVLPPLRIHTRARDEAEVQGELLDGTAMPRRRKHSGPEASQSLTPNVDEMELEVDEQALVRHILRVKHKAENVRTHLQKVGMGLKFVIVVLTSFTIGILAMSVSIFNPYIGGSSILSETDRALMEQARADAQAAQAAADRAAEAADRAAAAAAEAVDAESNSQMAAEWLDRVLLK